MEPSLDLDLDRYPDQPSPPAQQAVQQAVGVLILRGRRVLLLCRSPRASLLPAHWDTPGGKAEPGETLEQAATREVFEETGLVLEQVVGSLEPFSYSGTDGRPYIQTNYLGEVGEGPVTVNPREHTEARWFTLAEIDDPSWPMSAKTRRTARAALGRA